MPDDTDFGRTSLLDTFVTGQRPGSESRDDPIMRYLPRGHLGKGGMGSVDLVWDVDLLRELAIKRMHPELEMSPARVEGFLREARVMALLDHPSILSIYDLGQTEGGQPYIAMKRLRGMTLAALLTRTREQDESLPERYGLYRRLRLMVQVAYAMEAAHERGVLHQDLKPANIWVGPHGEVLVLDWGLALALPGADEEVAALLPNSAERQDASGTPMYMAPEQTDAGLPMDARSEVFSLGVILYQVATLEKPYRATELLELMVQVWEADLISLDQSGLDAGLRAVIEKATAREPEQRYESVAALRADLEAVLEWQVPEASRAKGALGRAAQFYVSSHPKLVNMRMRDLDIVGASGMFGGWAFGVWTAHWIGGYWAWAFLAVGVAQGFLFWHLRKVDQRRLAR